MARPFLERDVTLLSDTVHFCSHQQSSTSSSLIIPSLSSDSTLLQRPTDILSALRRESNAWCCCSASSSFSASSSSSSAAATAAASSNVFWSLVVAHTATFEGKHHHPVLAWIVPAVALGVLKFFSGTSSSSHHVHRYSRSVLGASIRVLQDQISKLFSQQLQQQHPPQSGPVLLFDSFRTESVVANPSRWVGLAISFLRQTLPGALKTMMFGGADGSGYGDMMMMEGEEEEALLLQLATTVVQALLSVWVPSRGIFIDRVKVHVMTSALASNCCDSCSSSSSDDSSDEEEDKGENSGGEHDDVSFGAMNNASASPARMMMMMMMVVNMMTAQRIEGVLLPPHSMTVEGLVVWRRWVRHVKLLKNPLLHDGDCRSKEKGGRGNGDFATSFVIRGEEINSSSSVSSSTTSLRLAWLRVNAVCFTCSLVDDAPPPLAATASCPRDGGSHHPIQDWLLAFCKCHRVSLVLCQRVVSPAIRVALARAGVLSVERLAITHFPAVQQHALRSPPVIHAVSAIPASAIPQLGATVAAAKVCLLASTNTIILSHADAHQHHDPQGGASPAGGQQQQQQPAGSTIVVSFRDNSRSGSGNGVAAGASSSFPAGGAAHCAAAVEKCILGCMRHVAQLLIEDTVVYKYASSFSSSSSSCSITRLVTRRVLQHIINSATNDGVETEQSSTLSSSSSSLVARACVRDVASCVLTSLGLHHHENRDDGEKDDEVPAGGFVSFLQQQKQRQRLLVADKTAASSQALLLLQRRSEMIRNAMSRYPECERVASIRDALLGGFELAGALCGIADVVG